MFSSWCLTLFFHTHLACLVRNFFFIIFGKWKRKFNTGLVQQRNCSSNCVMIKTDSCSAVVWVFPSVSSTASDVFSTYTRVWLIQFWDCFLSVSMKELHKLRVKKRAAEISSSPAHSETIRLTDVKPKPWVHRTLAAALNCKPVTFITTTLFVITQT